MNLAPVSQVCYHSLMARGASDISADSRTARRSSSDDRLQREFELLLGRWELGNIGTSIVYCGADADTRLDTMAEAGRDQGWQVINADFSDSDLEASTNAQLEEVGLDVRIAGLFEYARGLNEAAAETVADGRSGLLLVFKNLDALNPVELNQVMQASHRSNQRATPLALLASAKPEIRQRLADATSYGSRLYSIIDN